MYYIFFLTLIISIVTTFAIKQLALKFSVVDRPDSARKIHKKAIPLLGGLAIFVSFFLALYFNLNDVLARGLTGAHLVSFFLGAFVIVIGGVLDDIFNLSPRKQIIFPLLACAFILLGGIGIGKISNPWGGLFYFSGLISALITVCWLLGMMYTTKLLDGVDGLVSGLGAISGVIIFLFTTTTKYYQPDVGLMALIFAAACLGFLFFNFYPAKIFLGEAGSLFIGYVIGILAIISGGKIAIAMLVMGIPILDVAWTILRRALKKKNPFTMPDKMHLHHRLLALGLSQRQTVLLYYFLASAFGLAALFLQSRGKLMAFGMLAILMAGLVFLSLIKTKKTSTVANS
ncbi:MAG: MraY family glycosyltransferase [Patescibacteria group bacterium]